MQTIYSGMLCVSVFVCVLSVNLCGSNDESTHSSCIRMELLVKGTNLLQCVHPPPLTEATPWKKKGNSVSGP